MFGTVKKKVESKYDLLDLVFSWSFIDILNNNLFKNKVNKIPETFSSPPDYLSSYVHPLIEETRASLCSGLEVVGKAPACEISHVGPCKIKSKPSKRRRFGCKIRTIPITDFKNLGGDYEPESGDLILVTNYSLAGMYDLNISEDQFVICSVVKLYNDSFYDFRLSSVKEIGPDLRPPNMVYATYLGNMTTNMRIWSALDPDPKTANLSIIQKVLQYDSDVDKDCTLCLSQEESTILSLVDTLKLDESQKNAVLRCISMRKCPHQCTNVKLIWGPPGTGKTKTVASLLFVLLKLRCRTLTCAPTNIAVLQVAERLMGHVLAFLDHDTYGLGDIILFGNEKRMKIDDREMLLDVFLDYRVRILHTCMKHWYRSLGLMISLLDDPEGLYNEYVMKETEESDDNEKGKEEEEKGKEQQEKECPKGSMKKNNSQKHWQKVVNRTFEEAKKEKEKEKKEEKQKESPKRLRKKNNDQKQWQKVINRSLEEAKKEKEKESPKGSKKNNKNQKQWQKVINRSLEEAKEEKEKGEKKTNDEQESEAKNLMSFEEFFRKMFYYLADNLTFCAKNFYTHLPTSSIPLDVAKQMIRLNDLLNSLESGRKSEGKLIEQKKEEEILAILKSLHKEFPSPKIKGPNIEAFCLSQACLVFCTAASSVKVRGKVEMVIIDEAAQLKECESAIPLQLPGLKNAILIGDDRQLPATVQSKVSENANFGRSLFQRLATLGKNKHLLNIQYRMHPTISLFPNKEFYDKKIVDGPNVKEISYERRFLKEKMYGSYSFINVARGKEDFAKGHSPRNVEEATVVTRIIARLFKEHCPKNEKVSVGVISPYKGQVGLIEEKVGKKYDSHKETGFSVSVRSVDGFQGGEEDIIIISTVRGNRNGSVGFLSNHQRTNVALTRARYCLWIVGNGMTLVNSGSVWKDLVIDAITRGCFYNVEEGNPFDGSLEFDFLEQGKSRWKVLFSDDFKILMASLTTKNTNKKVREMVKKLAEGWRHSPSKKVVNSEFLEQYKVDNEQLYLAWSIDIVKEESKYLQVIKVWDILSASELPKLAKKLNASFGRYTVDVLNRCKYKSSEGNLAVPMSWPIQSVMIPLLEANPAECLAGQLAAIKLST